MYQNYQSSQAPIYDPNAPPTSRVNPPRAVYEQSGSGPPVRRAPSPYLPQNPQGYYPQNKTYNPGQTSPTHASQPGYGGYAPGAAQSPINPTGLAAGMSNMSLGVPEQQPAGYGGSA